VGVGAALLNRGVGPHREEHMTTRREVILAPLVLAMPAWPRAATGSVVVGTYPLEKMRSIPHLTFPRVLLYSSAGALIEKKSWPRALSSIERSSGDAFCCVSEAPSAPGAFGPPPDCKVIVYGEMIGEHFQGLIGADKRPLTRAQLPPHKYLIVEYYAAWCVPCLDSRKALDAFMASPQSAGYASLIVDFSVLQG
jgi:hypothetical protein